MEKLESVFLIDDENNEVEFEVVMTFQVETSDYVALLEKEDQSKGVLLYRVVEKNDDLIFLPIEDEDEYNIVAKAYDELM